MGLFETRIDIELHEGTFPQLSEITEQVLEDLEQLADIQGHAVGIASPTVITELEVAHRAGMRLATPPTQTTLELAKQLLAAY